MSRNPVRASAAGGSASSARANLDRTESALPSFRHSGESRNPGATRSAVCRTPLDPGFRRDNGWRWLARPHARRHKRRAFSFAWTATPRRCKGSVIAGVPPRAERTVRRSTLTADLGNASGVSNHVSRLPVFPLSHDGPFHRGDPRWADGIRAEADRLRVETDDLSTLLVGAPEALFPALQACFVKAASHSGHLVMNLSLSRGCPGEPDDPICRSPALREAAQPAGPGRIDAALARETPVTPTGIATSAQIALYPLGRPDYMADIADCIGYLRRAKLSRQPQAFLHPARRRRGRRLPGDRDELSRIRRP